MALHAAQMEESQKFYYRVKTAVLRLINRSPALRSILAPITRNPRLNPKERHALENSALRQRHTRERAMIERENRSMAAVDARELKALHQALHRKITETDMHSPSLMTRPAHENEPLHYGLTA